MQLTQREAQIVQLLASGNKSQKAVAAELGISRKTVDAHVMNVKKRLGVSKTSELIVLFLTEDLDRAA